MKNKYKDYTNKPIIEIEYTYTDIMSVIYTAVGTLAGLIFLIWVVL